MSVITQNLFDILGEDDTTVAAPAAAPAKQVVGSAQKSSSQSGNKNAGNNKGQSKNNNNKVSRPFAPKETGSNAPLANPKEFHHNDKNPRHRKPWHGREFDKKSGTGRRDDGLKKQTVGKGNWGDAVSADAENVAEKPTEEGAEETPVVPVVPEEPEEKLLTLQQFMAEKNAKKVVADVQVRKANEGSDEGKWKDAVVFKKEDEALFVGKNAEAKPKKIKEKASKATLDIEQKFTEPAFKPRGAFQQNDRDNRGDFKGRKGKPLSGDNRKPHLNAADKVAFPALGSH